MIVEYIINGIMILVGILLCCRGLRFYKAFQMFLCGALGGYIGLFIQQRFNNEWLIFLAIALFALGMILGYKYYKVPLCITSAVSVFFVVFSVFWKKAFAIYQEAIGNLLDVKDIFWDSVKNVKVISDIPNVVTAVFDAERNSISQIFGMLAGEIRKGMIISIVVAVIISVLVVIIGDFVVEVITSAVGAFILLNIASGYVNIHSVVYVIALIALSIIGLMSQINLKQKK